MKFDAILDHLGNFGTYQKRIVFITCLCAIPCAFHQYGQVFFAANVNFWCTSPEFEGLDCPPSWNLTASRCDEAKYSFLAPTEGENCLRFTNVTVQSFLDGQQPSKDWPTGRCDDWVYDTSQYKSTIIQEWDLVCDDKTKPAISQSIFFAGFLFGSFFIGALADRVGRKPMFFASVATQCIFSFAASFSSSYTMYTCLRFVVAVANFGVLMMPIILGTEWVGPSYRKYVMIYTSAMWATGQMSFAGLAFLIPRWRTLAMVASLSGVIFLALFPFTPESARWLIMQGRLKEANESIEKAARINSVVLPEKLFEEEDLTENPKLHAHSRGTVVDLFRTPNMRYKTLSLMFIWFVISCIYYGLSLSTSSLGVNDYVAFFVAGAVAIPGKILMVFVLDIVGRRHCTCWTMVIGGVGCILTIWTPKGFWTILTAMIGMFCASISFASVYIFSAELYPTPVRSTGMGISSTSARVGGVLSPLVLELWHIWAPLPYLIFGCLSIIGGLLTLGLPETNGLQLPETLEEGENFKRKSSSGEIAMRSDVDTVDIVDIVVKSGEANPSYDKADDKV